MSDATPRQKTVKATETSFAIAEYLSGDEPTGVTELADAFDLSKSTIHSHLQTLCSLGYVVKEGTEYRLGLKFLGLGDRARQRYNLYDVAKPEVDRLVEEVGERAQVMVEENAAGIYIYQSKADQAVQTDSHIGTVADLHTTAIGKAYLAFLEDDGFERIFDQLELTEQTPNTFTDPESFRDNLTEIADRGYAFNDQEKTIGMRAVGAPILSDDNHVLGAISVSGPTTRMKGTWFREEIPEMVTQSARVIGIKATYP